MRAAHLSLLVALATLRVDAEASRGALPPVILVPGSPAVELRDRSTGELVFPRAKLMFTRYGSDRFSLPFDAPETSDSVAGALITRVNVFGLSLKVDAYGPLLARLRAEGYREGDWSHPGSGPEYYVFLYDWRQSVESRGRILFQEMSALRARQPSGTPPFVMVAHSLGGLLLRYALMYGDAPLGSSGPLPPVTWKGGALMSRAFLVATPNDGAFSTLFSLQQGNFYRSGYGAFSPETLFSFPAVFDMIPARPDPLVNPEGSPLAWNLNDPADWERLGWSVFDPENRRRLTLAQARSHLRSELARKARLQEALEATGPSPNPVPLHLMGGECEKVPRSAVVSEIAGRLHVTFSALAGDRARLNALLFEPGDSMISRRSLIAEDLEHDPRSSLAFTTLNVSCSSHRLLMSSPLLIDPLLAELKRDAPEPPLEPSQ